MSIPEFRPLQALLRRTAHRTRPTTECLDELTLAGFIEGNARVERGKVLGHLAECSTCRMQVAELDDLVGDARVAAELAALAGSARAPRRIPVRSLAWAGVAAAALMMLLPGMPGRNDNPHVLRDVRGTVVSAPTPVEPMATTTSVPTFRWTSTPGADRYRVTVFTTDGVVAWETEVADTSVVLPTASQLERGVTYLWKVQARTDFDRWVASRLAEFRLDGGRVQ